MGDWPNVKKSYRFLVILHYIVWPLLLENFFPCSYSTSSLEPICNPLLVVCKEHKPILFPAFRRILCDFATSPRECDFNPSR